jgi:hypothetical protein
VALDQVTQAETWQVLHHVVVDSVLGLAIIEDFDGVRMRERRGELDLALETLQGIRLGQSFRPDQLDGAGAFEEMMLGEVDLSHPAAANPLQESVLAQLPSLGNLAPQPGHPVRPERGAGGHDQQDHRVKGEQREPGGFALSLPQPSFHPRPRTMKVSTAIIRGIHQGTRSGTREGAG